jgi:hypothetical protein
MRTTMPGSRSVSAVCFEATRGWHEYVDLTRRSRPSAFFSIAQCVPHGFCQLLLVLGQKRFNFVVSFVADRVDQGSDLFPLARAEFPDPSSDDRVPEATRIRGWNSRRRARTMRRASQTANTRKIPTITRITTGWNAMSKDAPIAITSSPILSRMLDKGSGDALAAKRVAAFVPCELRDRAKTTSQLRLDRVIPLGQRVMALES